MELSWKLDYKNEVLAANAPQAGVDTWCYQKLVFRWC